LRKWFTDKIQISRLTLICVILSAGFLTEGLDELANIVDGGKSILPDVPTAIICIALAYLFYFMGVNHHFRKGGKS
jgi:hypothetical protein